MKTNRLTLCALFTALTAVGAFIQIPIRPVPITLQTLFVMLSALYLTPKEAFSSQVAYILLGLMGLPIFSGFEGGLQRVIHPAFGFLISFAIAAPLMSYILKDNKDTKNLIFAALCAYIVFYAVGLTYLYVLKNFYSSTEVTFAALLLSVLVPCIPGDILKAFATVLMGRKLKNL